MSETVKVHQTWRVAEYEQEERPGQFSDWAMAEYEQEGRPGHFSDWAMVEYEQEGRPGHFSDWATDEMAKKFTVPFSAWTRYFQTIP